MFISVASDLQEVLREAAARTQKEAEATAPDAGPGGQGDQELIFLHKARKRSRNDG